MDPAKLKVVELRAELASRGLDTKGNKPVLVKRLREALEAESGNELPDTSIADTSTEDLDASNVSLRQPSPPSEPARKSKEPEPKPPSESGKDTPAESPPKSVKSETKTESPPKSVKTESPPKPTKTEVKTETPKSTKTEVKTETPKPTKAEVKTESPAKFTKSEVKAESTPKSTKTEVKTDSAPKSTKTEGKTESPAKSTKTEVKTESAPKSTKTEKRTEETVAPPPKESVAARKEKSVPEMKKKEPLPKPEPEKPKVTEKVTPKKDAPKAPEESMEVEPADTAAQGDADKQKDEPQDVEMTEGAAAEQAPENAEAEKDAEPRRKSRWGTESAETPTVEESAPSESPRGEKRRHGSPSPDRVTRKRSRSPVREDEPEIVPEDVNLSWIDSDLNLQVNKENFTVAEPMHTEGFGYMWAGVRATHGVNNGKVRFEVKLLEHCEWDDSPKEKKDKNRDKRTKKDDTKRDESKKDDTKKDDTKKDDTKKDESKKDDTKKDESKKEEAKNDESKKDDSKNDESKKDESKNDESKKDEAKKDETEKEKEKEKPKEEEPAEKEPTEPIHVFRVGWSLPSTDLQLGEQPFSYGYDSEGLAATNSEFVEYGIQYSAEDVIGAYLDLGPDTVTITYTVNGALLPSAFTVERSQLPEDSALFPHILTRNIKFEVNFGQKEEPWYQPPDEFSDYTFIKNVEDKIAGLSRPTERKACEVLMMVGLPCSGKTFWVNNYVSENPEKKYNVLGLGNVLDKMKYRGQSRKEHFKGSTTVLMDKCTRCLTKLIDIASARRRNYIIDQTNLFSSAQRRKMRPFDGFRRQAVVIVVADDEQSSREKSRQQADGKDVPDSAVLEMKANMCLPTVCDWLDEVKYAELEEEPAKEIVQKYNKQGREAGYGPNYTAKAHNNQKLKFNDKRNVWGRNNKRDSSRDSRNNRWGGGGGHNRQNNWGNNRGSGGWGRHDGGRNHHHGGGGRGGDYRNNSNNRMMSGGGGGGGGYNRNQGGSGGGGGYNRKPHPRNPQNKGGNWGGQGGGGSWSGQGSWGGQGGWASGHQSGGQGSGWNQGSWGQYGNGQGGGSSQGGGQQWKGGYNNAQQYQQQGYAQGYAASQYGQGQYPNWNYYGQYAQGWNNPQGQQSNSGNDGSGNTAQYNQYTQQQQAAWAQYAQSGYGGYGQAASQGSSGGNAVTGTAANQQTSTTK